MQGTLRQKRGVLYAFENVKRMNDEMSERVKR
jgi:hypothetical protein